MVTGRRDGGGGGRPKTRMLQEIGHLRGGGGQMYCNSRCRHVKFRGPDPFINLPWLIGWIQATLKNNSVSGRAPGCDHFTTLPGRIFLFLFFFEKFSYFSHFLSDFQSVFTILCRMVCG